MSNEDKQQIALHKAEVKELQRQYDRDLKLQDFLSIKGRPRNGTIHYARRRTIKFVVSIKYTVIDRVYEINRWYSVENVFFVLSCLEYLFQLKAL